MANGTGQFLPTSRDAYQDKELLHFMNEEMLGDLAVISEELSFGRARGDVSCAKTQFAKSGSVSSIGDVARAPDAGTRNKRAPG